MRMRSICPSSKAMRSISRGWTLTCSRRTAPMPWRPACATTRTRWTSPSPGPHRTAVRGAAQHGACMGRADRPPAASGQGCARRCALGSGGAGNGAGAWSGHLRIGHDPVHRPRHRHPARHRTLSRPAPWRDRRGGRRDAVPDPRRPRPRAGGHRARDLCRPGPLRHCRPRAPARGDADRVRRDRGPDQRHRRHPRGPWQPRRRPHRGQPGARRDHPPRRR